MCSYVRACISVDDVHVRVLVCALWAVQNIMERKEGGTWFYLLDFRCVRGGRGVECIGVGGVGWGGVSVSMVW